MLILKRKVGERIVIGNDINVMVVEVDRVTRQVKLGIDAPKEVPVHREEVQRRIERENHPTYEQLKQEIAQLQHEIEEYKKEYCR